MARRGSLPPDEEEDDDLEDEEEPPRRRPSSRSTHARSRSKGGRPTPVRRWRSSTDEEDEDDAASNDDLPSAAAPTKPRRSVYWRARDSLFFEPLVALAIIVLLFVALFAYTQNWPPVYVVESGSMQHGSNDIVGLINAGDLVLAQRIPTDQITTYMIGTQTGFSTYGEYGDVLLYHPNGQGATPIIHRALIELFYDNSTRVYSAPSLLPFQNKCGTNPQMDVYYSPGCNPLALGSTLSIYGIGWRAATLSISVNSTVLGPWSGFLTAGDGNFVPGSCSTTCQVYPDQPIFSYLVQPSWVIGVARGMIPWFGAFKLVFTSDGPNVPTQSWEYMGVTISAVILAALGLHFLFRAEGIESDLRRQEEDEESEAEEEEDEGSGRRHRWLPSLRSWRREDDEEPEPDEPPRHRPRKNPESTNGGRRGRPRPRVRREKKSRSRKDDEEL
jgi:signal peptidase I